MEYNFILNFIFAKCLIKVTNTMIRKKKLKIKKENKLKKKWKRNKFKLNKTFKSYAWTNNKMQIMTSDLHMPQTTARVK